MWKVHFVHAVGHRIICPVPRLCHPAAKAICGAVHFLVLFYFLFFQEILMTQEIASAWDVLLHSQGHMLHLNRPSFVSCLVQACVVE